MSRTNMKTSIKGVWVSEWENETGAPEKRIIHGKCVKISCIPEKMRIGVRMGKGYFKCGSEDAIDWITEFAVYQWEDKTWHKIMHITGLKKPQNNVDIQWFEIEKNSTAYYFEVRRSGIDGWWPCYNIAQTGFVIEAKGLSDGFMRPVRNLHKVKYEPDTFILSEESILATRTSTAVRYQSPYYSIGFRLKSAGLDFLGLDGAGTGKTHENLLALDSILFDNENDFNTQGPVINPISIPPICGFLSYEVEGETEVYKNSLKYRMCSPQTGLSIELVFTMKRSAIHLDMKLRSEKTIKLMDISLFRIAFNSRKIPLTALGSIIKEGETGALTLPLLLNLPGYSGIRIQGIGQATCRFNSIRPSLINTFDFKLGDILCEDGCYIIKKGEYTGKAIMNIGFSNHIELKDDTPEAVRGVFDRYLYTSLPYRADTATFSNNGNSMGAPICLDLWGELCQQIDKDALGIDSFDFLKNTIEIHLLGAPAYGAGRHYSGEYDYEDEYLMTGTAVLLGIARFLEKRGTRDWYEKFNQSIINKITAMKKRDIDGDGLVESTRRKGISGEHQWSTCWYDVVSYGYKDAFSNALLYQALCILSKVTAQFGNPVLSRELHTWADKIKEVYQETFMTENGWLAGWKCMKGKLHDYGFLAVNGAAVTYGLLEKESSYAAISKLWKELLNSGYDSFDIGLPGNIFCIDNTDMADVQHALPFGGYQNGGITLSQSRHFIEALYTVGMDKEADFILNETCMGLLHGNIIGGVNSGCDWKTWDGVSSGYEGILTDQLGFFIPMIKRYRINKL